MTGSDEISRQLAIDTRQSFIVQAPAGSGKTELLTQRYLNLLAKASHAPEEIIAITFTRKAAAEMRERILNALNMEKPETAHQQTTWKLAREVLAQDKKQQWQLLENPNRMRILTIDALSAMLCSYIPLLSGFGAEAHISENVEAYYQQAIQETLENPAECLPALQTLLLHLNNNADLLSRLLFNLLGKREQWLTHIIPFYRQTEELKQALTGSLQRLVAEKLKQADNSVPKVIRQELLELLRFAGNELLTLKPEHKLCCCSELATLPPPDPDYLPQWQAIAELLLTKQYEFRKLIDKRNGFPANKKTEKKRMMALINSLTVCDDLKMSLADVLNCPQPRYSEQQWQVIEALLQLLPRVVAELQIQFRQNAAMDFVELSLGAKQALGSEEAPSDLAMHLDYQIRHLLIDEFQDTSVAQYHLITQLVREWQPNEGKTLFLVGDPMQSIYRFRNAEVSLFIRAAQEGIANIPLKALTLNRNFRSSEAIVGWVNQSFKTIFPQKNDMTLGAIAYSPSFATQENLINQAINYYSFAEQQQASQEMLNQIIRLQKDYPDHSIAILARARSQLKPIMQLLDRQRVAYRAVELNPLSACQEVIDVLSLSRALTHWGDSIAWLAILRAPWCGLRLIDLHKIARYVGDRPVWPLLCQYDNMDLSDDGRQRLHDVCQILDCMIRQQNQLPLMLWIKNTWLALGGQACVDESADENINAFFDLLEKIQGDFSRELLIRELDKLYAKPNPQGNIKLQLMTIHKSKGLEFDHVILPELQYKSPPEKNELMMWLENPNDSSEDDLILAPIKASEEATDSIHHYLKHLESHKLSLEAARLLYVAVTRAKKSLHFYCQLKKEEEILPPAPKSLLSFLWPQYESNFIENYQQQSGDVVVEETNFLSRLPADWKRPYSVATTHYSAPAQQVIERPEISQAAIIGTVIHEALAKAANQQSMTTAYWQTRFLSQGLNGDILDKALGFLETALQNIQNDKRGQWILASHLDAENEYAITTFEAGQYVNYIIDRTFIDEEGSRWIIDYKTSQPESIPFQEFLIQQKQCYQAQLHIYANALRKVSDRRIRLGLYFPLCSGWIDWDTAIYDCI